MGFERVEADGSVYYYDGKNFFDEYFLVLQGDDLRRATEAYFSQFDYTKYNAEEILVYIKKLKHNQMYSQTKGVMDYAMEKFADDGKFLYKVLPLYTSCCREMGNPLAAIEKVESFRPWLSFSSVLCTSLAAAYLDLKRYDEAKKYLKLAYARQGGGQGYKTELSLVFLRYKKETGESFFDDEE